MTRYIARRLGASVVLLAVVSLLLFVVLRVLPGDPTMTLLGGVQGADEDAANEIRKQLGLNDSLPSQYAQWVGGMLTGDFGQSYFSQTSVNTLVAQRIWPTVELTLVAMIMAVLIAFPLALVAALRPNSMVDRTVGAFTTMTMAVPSFLIAIVLVVVFSVRLGALPTRGYVPLLDDPLGNLRVVLLPALTLALTSAAPILRFLRTSLAEVSAAPYMRTARGKGLRWPKALVGHALPNALLPTLTVMGLIVGRLLGGVVVIEYIFGWPGLGTLIVDAVLKRDYAVLQTTVLFAAAAFIVSALVVDVLYGVVDPRLRIRPKEAA
ncbi:MAG: ABC transporter permease [Nocardioidaceae bacterium]